MLSAENVWKKEKETITVYKILCFAKYYYIETFWNKLSILFNNKRQLLSQLLNFQNFSRSQAWDINFYEKNKNHVV